jgi:hypothetical protein
MCPIAADATARLLHLTAFVSSTPVMKPPGRPAKIPTQAVEGLATFEPHLDNRHFKPRIEQSALHL